MKKRSQGQGQGQGRGQRLWPAAVAAVAASMALAGCAASDPDDGGSVQQRDQLARPDAPDTGGHGSSSGDAGQAGSGQADPGQAGSGDAAELVELAVTAWGSNAPTAFVTFLGQARDACSQPGAARRLAEVTAIAQRWSSALADGRPKVQATTEGQLSNVDWKALAAACSQS